jgi:hypothetical protein
MRLFPGIAYRGMDWDRPAWVIGTALDVWQIVDAYRDLGSIARMAEGESADERQIRLASATTSDSRTRSIQPSLKIGVRSGISKTNSRSSPLAAQTPDRAAHGS